MPELESFQTPACEFRYEPEKVKGSRFIADVAPVQSGEEAEAFVKRIRAEFPDACHHCYAWRTGMEGKNNRANDDGEPGGSAGRPILAQLEGHELTQLVVVVTRYFGGTKLGVGGLMRAYGGAAGQALDRAQIETKIITEPVAFAYPYDCSGPVEGVLTGITDPFAIRRILAHFGLPTEVTPLEPPRPPPEPDLPWEVSLAPA